MKQTREARTHYSPDVPGATGNYNWPVRFDRTRGYVGITQWDPKDPNRVTDRILLSPEQQKQLLNFLNRRSVNG